MEPTCVSFRLSPRYGIYSARGAHDWFLRMMQGHEDDPRCARLWRAFVENQPEISRRLARTPESLDRIDWDRFIATRRSGEIPGWRRSVGDRSVEYDLKFMLAVLNWAVGAKIIESSPWRPEIRVSQHWPSPKEQNPKRPSMPDDLLGKL